MVQRLFLRAADQPWGDYGSLLAYGMTAQRSRTEAGRLQLERTGPLVPPIWESGIADLLVTEDGWDELVAEGFTGIDRRPVELAHIVRLEWERWDLAADDPAFYPDGGEPEDYVLGAEHDPELAASMPQVWEVVLRPWREVPDVDLSRALPERSSILVSERFGTWIAEHHSRWLRTEMVTFAD